MKFLKRHWFKIFILLPFIPAWTLVRSFDVFTGVDRSLLTLASFVLIVASLMLFFVGLFLEISKGNLEKKKYRFKLGDFRFGLAEIGRVIFSIVVIAFLYTTINYTILSMRIGDVLVDIAAPEVTDDAQADRSYSLVTMASFDINNQRSYGRIGVLAVTDEYKNLAVEGFLSEQNFIPNPIQEPFNSPIDMLNALYDDEVDAIIIGSNFAPVFEELNNFEYIEQETIVLDQFNVEQEQILRAEIDPGEPFSILLLGLDTRRDGNLSTGNIDTFMLLTVNLESLSFTIVSIPRDSLVQIPDFNYQYDKLAHTNMGGSMLAAVGAVEHMLDMEIPYYVLVNFSGVIDIVDVLGGITVDVPFSFREQDSQRRRDEEHLIHLEEGTQRLDAEQALALTRFRGTIDHDFGRAQNGQLVMEALIREMLSSMTGINDALPIIESLGRNIRTNFTAHELTLLAQYMLEYLPRLRNVDLMEEVHFIQTVILGDTPEHLINVGHGYMSVVLPWEGRIAEARRLMMINLGLEDPDFNFTFEFDGFTRPGRRQWGETNETHGSNGIITPEAPPVYEPPVVEPVNPVPIQPAPPAPAPPPAPPPVPPPPAPPPPAPPPPTEHAPQPDPAPAPPPEMNLPTFPPMETVPFSDRNLHGDIRDVDGD